MAKSSFIGALRVGVIADTKRASQNLKAFSKQTKSFGNNAKKAFGIATKAIGGFLGIAGIGGIAGLVAGLRSAADDIDKIAKTSDKLGISTEALVGMQHAAEMTGVATDTLNMALQRMVRRVAEAAKGTGEAKGALKELNLQAVWLNKLAPDRQFAEIADAMAKIENPADRVRLAMKLFDSEGVALVNTLALGSAGLAEMQVEADKLGLTFSRVEAEKIEKFNDAMKNLKLAFGGTMRDIVIDIAPAASEAIEALRLIMSAINPKTGKSFSDTHFPVTKAIWKGYSKRATKFWEGTFQPFMPTGAGGMTAAEKSQNKMLGQDSRKLELQNDEQTNILAAVNRGIQELVNATSTAGAPNVIISIPGTGA